MNRQPSLELLQDPITLKVRTKELRAIEDLTFPFEDLSDIAEAESWRKEVYRPIYHVHKWWARRLGSVFRAIVLGSLSPSGSNVLDLFYRAVNIPEAIVFDPFMGSGTTIGEALKLGANAIGRDINPVAYFLVRNGLGAHNREDIIREFHKLEKEVAPRIKYFYRSIDSKGRIAETLYYFWVKTLDCPRCDTSVDLFSKRIFAQHAYPKKYPISQASCPHCGEVNAVNNSADEAICFCCKTVFNPQLGAARGQTATCPQCNHVFSISKEAKRTGYPPKSRLYAKLILTCEGEKEYRKADEFDLKLYAEAEQELSLIEDAYPVVQLTSGFNTNQAIGYGYNYWHEFFNVRQLLCLSLLANSIKRIENVATRELFVCLFSGTLEFNNMFASYKGEGTGAVRHMFAHHILKPERTPLEANLWGTNVSSGAFSTLFKSRILRAIDYANDPFELRRNGQKTSKVHGLSKKIGFENSDNYEEFKQSGKRLYLSCGDSSSIDLPDGSVDAVITDPPFYDNVHYSELADFFYAWQRFLLVPSGDNSPATTRADGEVQDENKDDFTRKLKSVLIEVARVLRNDGLLVFTYHHSRSEGWTSVAKSLLEAGFIVVNAHPVKAEMSVAMPKNQAKEPIDLDVILVCRKRISNVKKSFASSARNAALDQVQRLVKRSRRLSRNDIRVIVMAQVLVEICAAPDAMDAADRIPQREQELEFLIEELYAVQK